jgi:hypothetical protein
VSPMLIRAYTPPSKRPETMTCKMMGITAMRPF